MSIIFLLIRKTLITVFHVAVFNRRSRCPLFVLKLPDPDDGQLHTLGLLERLRSETHLSRGPTPASTSAWTNCCGRSKTRTCTTSAT